MGPRWRGNRCLHARPRLPTDSHTPPTRDTRTCSSENRVSKGGYHGTASRYIARLYQTVVLRLPYITSEDRGAGSVVLVAPARPGVLSRSVSPLTSEIDEEEARRRPRGRAERSSKRSHRPRVVAGIPAADFICRMSTSRGHGGTNRGTQNASLRRDGESKRTVGGGCKKRRFEAETVRSCAAMGPGSDPDPTAPNGN